MWWRGWGRDRDVKKCYGPSWYKTNFIRKYFATKVRETVKHRVAVRVSVDSHEFIGDEINHWENLEYNQNRVYMVDQYLDEEEWCIEEENQLIQQQIEDKDEE